MSTLGFESRQALRTLARNPWHAIVATSMLAAGLGLTMYMFGAVNAFLLRPLPFPDQEELTHVELADPKTGRNSVEMPLHEFIDLAARKFVVHAFVPIGRLPVVQRVEHEPLGFDRLLPVWTRSDANAAHEMCFLSWYVNELDNEREITCRSWNWPRAPRARSANRYWQWNAPLRRERITRRSALRPKSRNRRAWSQRRIGWNGRS